MPSLYYLHPELAENHQQLSRGQLAGKLAQLFSRLREQEVLQGDDKQLAHLVQHFQMVQTGWVTTLKHSATPSELERMVKDGAAACFTWWRPTSIRATGRLSTASARATPERRRIKHPGWPGVFCLRP